MPDDGLEVHGGAGSVAVETAAIRERAALLRGVGADVAALAPQVLGLGLDPGLAVAGLLDPYGATRLQAHLVAAVAGPDGLLAAALRSAELAAALEVAAVAYEAADASARDVLDWAWRQVAAAVLTSAARFAAAAVTGGGALLASGAAVTAAAGAGAWVAYRAGPAVLSAAADAAGDLAGGELSASSLDDRARAVADEVAAALTADALAAGGAALSWAARNPWVTEQLLATHLDVLAQVSVVGRVLVDRVATGAGLPPVPRDLAGSGRWLVAGSTVLGTIDRGPVRVQAVGQAKDVPGATGVAGLFSRLAPATAHHPGHPPVPRGQGAYRPGQVRLERTAPAGGGRAAWTVFVPPTQTWSTAGGPNPFDGTSNLVGFSGARADAGEAVLQVLRSAGVPPDEPVLLVGYSQGGITAAQLAADASVREEFDVAAVLTVGSPVALLDVPPQVEVLSVQHDQDLVTVLDGEPNPAAPTRTTVTRDLLDPVTGDAAVAAGLSASPFLPHGYAAYAETARRVDAAEDPALRAWRRTLTPFLAAPGTTTTAWQWQATRR